MPDPLADALAREDLTAEARRKLGNVRDVLAADPQARLLSLFFLGPEPYASVAFGDLDRAEAISVVMHGIDTDLAQFPAWADSARRLCADAIRASTLRGGSGRIATVIWFCYDSGTHVTALATKHATIGAGRLAVDLDRLAALRPNGPGSRGPRIAVLAYSYSSTLFGELVLLGGAGPVDAAFSIASAGMTRIAADAVAELIEEGSLVFYVTESSTDTTAPLGRLGAHPIDPRDIDGAIVYGSDGGPIPGLDGYHGKATDGHASQTSVDEHGHARRGYFDPQAQAYLFAVERLADLVQDA